MIPAALCRSGFSISFQFHRQEEREICYTQMASDRDKWMSVSAPEEENFSLSSPHFLHKDAVCRKEAQHLQCVFCLYANEKRRREEREVDFFCNFFYNCLPPSTSGSLHSTLSAASIALSLSLAV